MLFCKTLCANVCAKRSVPQCPIGVQAILCVRCSKFMSVGDQIGRKVASFMQNAQHIDPDTFDAIEEQEGEAVKLPDAQRLVSKEMGVAARANAKLKAQAVQRGFQFGDEALR